jgi:hypothetical protein
METHKEGGGRRRREAAPSVITKAAWLRRQVARQHRHLRRHDRRRAGELRARPTAGCHSQITREAPENCRRLLKGNARELYVCVTVGETMQPGCRSSPCAMLLLHILCFYLLAWRHGQPVAPSSCHYPSRCIIEKRKKAKAPQGCLPREDHDEALCCR